MSSGCLRRTARDGYLRSARTQADRPICRGGGPGRRRGAGLCSSRPARQESNAHLPGSRGRPAQASHSVSGQRDPADRGGHGPRRLLGKPVDPLPPAVALPHPRARLLRADRAQGVGARRARAPAHADGRHPRAGRRALRPGAADVEQRRRDLALPPERADDLLLPQRRGRRGHLRPRGDGHARDDLRRPAVPRGRLRRRPPRDDVPLRIRRSAAPRRLRVTGPDRDPAALPQPVRAAARARALLPPGHPSARPSCGRTGSAATSR